MDTLRLKPRQPVEDEIENWDDDDDFMIDNDDLSFRSASTNQHGLSHRRDSQTSHRSERESLHADEVRQVHLPGDDEKSTLDAIAAATNAGIPIPKNVPPSALMGGTIKRLGGKKIKKIFQEDWADDLEMPDSDQALRIKPQDGSKFPEVLRQVSGGSLNPSPSKPQKPTIIQALPIKSLMTPTLAAPVNLDKFRDEDEDMDFFGDGSATIKAPKLRPQAKPISLITPPTPLKKGTDDDFEEDFELPTDGKLKLARRKDIPKTPSLNSTDDFDWGEGSLGTRFGGTKRDAFSNRSSSVSALSPSISSSMTAESENEEEALDGLVIPNEPLNFGERLKRRRLSQSPERNDSDRKQRSAKQSMPHTDNEDMLSGLDFGDGDVFTTAKPTLHRNVKVKETRQTSPVRPKTAVSITFTNKPVSSAPISRLPRPTVSHERTHTQSSLEPVSESGGPIPSRSLRRSQSRLGGHSAQSSVSSITTPTTPVTPITPSTPRRRELGSKASTGTLRNEPTTTSAQLLRLKRSLPVLRGPQSPARPVSGRFDRPPSRTDSNRPQSSLRPKTPVDRIRPGYDGSAAQQRKNPLPFLPAGASQTQSQHVTSKSSRVFRRHDSDYGPETRPLSRTVSRSTMRSPSPRKSRPADRMASEPAWQQLSKPRRHRQFGDGHELDAFDDLPTSAQAESKFVKLPIGSGNRTNIRNKIYQNLTDRNTPSPVSPYSPARVDYQPHFARDTAASRMAREASLAQRAPAPTMPLTAQRVAQLSARPPQPLPLATPTLHRKKTRKPTQLKPHLISNLNSARDSKVVSGMTYNPDTFRWEGNENALNLFDAPASSPSATSLPPHLLREKENTTPRPVLITNMSATKGVKRVGDMVFDPQNMCWLKVDTSHNTNATNTPGSRSDDPMDLAHAIANDDDDDDPFKDIPDLPDNNHVDELADGAHGGRVSDIKDDWLVGEEFDVGPEFVRRQREEEARWRKKCEKWVGKVERDQVAWRWAIRDIVMGS